MLKRISITALLVVSACAGAPVQQTVQQRPMPKAGVASGPDMSDPSYWAKQMHGAILDADRQSAANNPAQPAATRDSVSPQWMAAYRQAVADSMRDPSSVQFRRLTAVKDPDGTAGLCGDLNAKNGFGGYAGFEPFYASVVRVGSKAVAVPWTVSSVGLQAIQQKCGAV
jgi:hypothetical protein